MYDREIDRIFRKMSNSFFNMGDVFEEFNRNGSVSEPRYYGYTVTVGLDGRPVVTEYGNVQSGRLESPDTREPIVDTIIDQKENVVKLIAEMPGVEETDVKIVVKDKNVDLFAERDGKRYRVKVPLQHRVDEGSAKTFYKNGILELVFKIVEEKPKDKTVEARQPSL